MMFTLKKGYVTACVVSLSLLLSACSGTDKTATAQHGKQGKTKLYRTHKTALSNPQQTLQSLTEQHQAWQGTRYRLGGTSKSGVDCSGFMQVTFNDLFGIKLPRTTVEQAKVGQKVAKQDLRTGDLVFFNTGRGPNGKHVGVYVKGDQFLHASTKGGIIYSSLNSPYWSKAFWQARRL